MPFWKWSKTAASNASADGTINWAEGQPPSSVNDSARAMMARLAEFRDDISGALVTSGTATAYTVSSNQGFDTLAHMDGALIAFTPHATNTGTVTLNVDGLGAKPLRSATGIEIPASSLILGTPYVATYYNTAGEWILQGAAFSNPYNIPLGSGVDYWGDTAPNSAFAFPYGQAISRTTYATLYTLIGTKYGTGDGSTTFNLPDKRGRLSAALDTMGGTSADRLNPTIASGVLGSSGGSQNRTLVTANLPAYTPSGTITNGAITNTVSGGSIGGTSQGAFTSGNFDAPLNVSNIVVSSSQATSTFTGTAQGGSSTAFAIVQPTIMCNYIMRVI